MKRREAVEMLPIETQKNEAVSEMMSRFCTPSAGSVSTTSSETNERKKRASATKSRFEESDERKKATEAKRRLYVRSAST
eukprot:6096626-Pleurochrysis_carterae.AAC.1